MTMALRLLRAPPGPCQVHSQNDCGPAPAQGILQAERGFILGDDLAGSSGRLEVGLIVK